MDGSQTAAKLFILTEIVNFDSKLHSFKTKSATVDKEEELMNG